MAKIAVIAFCGLLKVFNNCDVSVIFSASGSMRIVDDILLETFDANYKRCEWQQFVISRFACRVVTLTL